MSGSAASGCSRRVSTRLIVVVILAVLIATAIVVRVDRHLSFWVQDVVHDNVPSYVSCDDAPMRDIVEKRLAEATPWDSMKATDDVIVTPGRVRQNDRCPEKAVLEIRYGGTRQRSAIEDILRDTGVWDPLLGWSWQSFPVSLRNE